MARLFGTDGIRGEAGVTPLDPATVRALGAAIGRVLASASGHPARVVLGRDTRESGPSLVADVARGLASAGALVRSAGVIPTPGVSFLARSGDFDAGVVVSASHNPWRDNGLKIFGAAGTKLPDELEAAVEAEAEAALAAAAPVPDRAPPPDEPALADRYLDWLADRGRAIAGELGGLDVALDCAHGAAHRAGPRLLQALGARVHALGCAPDGRNINEGCGSLHLEALASFVRREGCALGIALDGDADRALFVDHEGRTVDGDQVLLLAGLHLRERGALRGGAVVGTVMSNLGLERALAAHGLLLLRERVGDRFVLERMQAAGANLGGEPSGHVIFLDEAPTGDGLVTALQVLGAVRAAGVPLAELAARMPRCPQVLVNVRVRERVPLEHVPGYPALAADWAARLGDDGRMLVRYSGTERLVRVMVEGTNEALVGACAESLAGHLRDALA